MDTATPRPAADDTNDDDPLLGLVLALAIFIVLAIAGVVAMSNAGLGGTPGGDQGSISEPEDEGDGEGGEAASSTTEAPDDEATDTTAAPTTDTTVAAARPVELALDWQPEDAVTVSGVVQSDDQRSAVEAAVTESAGEAPVELDIELAEGEVDADSLVAVYNDLVTALPGSLTRGRLGLTEDTLSVSGQLAPGVGETVFDELLAEAEGDGVATERDLATVAGYEREIEVGDEGQVTARGTVASEDRRSALIGALAGVFGEDSVIDELQLAEVDPSAGTTTLVGTVTGQQAEALRAAAGGEIVDQLVIDEQATAVEDLNALFALEPILFDTGSATITAESLPTIDRAAEILASVTDTRLLVVGHTDDQGEAADNLALSEARAASVVAALVERGVAADRLEAEGRGETEPVADNATDEGREQNRRIEFELL